MDRSFIAAFAGILILYLFKVLNLQTLKKAVDLDLLLILVCSLSLGLALNSSGAAGVLVNFLIQLTEGAVPMVGLVILFIITLVLTSLITNAAAVSIMFPIALELGNQLEQPLTPFSLQLPLQHQGTL